MFAFYVMSLYLVSFIVIVAEDRFVIATIALLATLASE